VIGTGRPAPLRALALAGLAAAALAAGRPASAQTAAQVRRETESLAVEERLGAAVPRDGRFEEGDGRPFALAELAGRPVLLTFNYAACKLLCGIQLAGIARALHELRWDGTGFSIVAVSIDPEETQEAMRRSKDEVVRQVGGGEGVARAWRFVRGPPEDVEALARSVGFKYRRDAATGQIAHPATLVVLTGDGRVSGYLHGVRPEPDGLRAAVERAGAGRVATAEEQAGIGGFLLTCIGLDPSGKAPLALRVMRAAGSGAALFSLGFLALQAVRATRRRRGSTP
jgi:protein SCO1/2